jgi:hypothetical protein
MGVHLRRRVSRPPVRPAITASYSDALIASVRWRKIGELTDRVWLSHPR